MPRIGDADFTVERLVARANDDLASGLGNLVNRVTTMVHRYRDGVVPAAGDLATGPDLAAGGPLAAVTELGAACRSCRARSPRRWPARTSAPRRPPWPR